MATTIPPSYGNFKFFVRKYVNSPAISKNYPPNHKRIVDLGRKTNLVQDFQSEMVTNSIRAIRKQGYWRQLWFAINSFSRIFFLLRKLVSLAGQINFFFQSVIIGYIFYRTMLQDITTGNIANTSLAYEMISQSLTWLSIALVVGTFVRLINLLDSEESGANNKINKFNRNININNEQFSSPPNNGISIIWKKIIAVIDATFAVAKRKPEKKFRFERDSNPWPQRYRCSTLPIELISQLGAGR